MHNYLLQVKCASNGGKMEAAQNNYIDRQHDVAEKEPMGQTATAGHWRAATNGANVGALMSTFYPVTENTVSETIRTSVRLTKEQHADIRLISELWDDLDRAFGHKRRRKWSDAAVIERLLTVGIDGFWAQVGGRPETAKDRKTFLAEAVERLKKAPKK